MAALLILSPKYLNDIFKQESVKSALELMPLYMISEAKNMLVEG